MAEPRITGIEVHTYTYTLDNLGKDYNGFNLVYQQGSTVKQTGHIIRILTDAGLVGEYAGGSAADYAILPSFAHYLIGKNALERERIYADVKRALRQVARIGLAPVDIALWDLAGKYYETPIYRLLGGYKAWFADPSTAMGAVILVEAWHSFPFFTLLIMAGLKGIPADLYKAADIDGAGPLAKLRLITLPMLRTIIAAAVILRVIGLVNSPDLLLILTQGGPGRATQVLSLYAFQNAYQDFNFGYAGALSVVMFVLLMLFAWAYIRLSKVNQD